MAARAAGIDAVDGPFANFNDDAAYRVEAERAKALGMVGKWAIHPSQIQPALDVFSPSREEVDRARRIEEAYREAEAAGLGAVQVDGVMIGTTHFINAVVQRRHLTKVAALRLGLPSGASLPPFCDWPEDLGELVRGGVWMVEGGHEYDGRPFMPLDEAAVLKAALERQASA